MNDQPITPSTPPRIVSLTGAAYPSARIDSVDAANGLAVFAYLDANGAQIDSGGSIARFTPLAALPPAQDSKPGDAPTYPEVPDATLADAIANPAPEPAGVVVLTPLTILGRLTQAEETALASSTDLAVSIVRNRMIAASEVRSDDPRTAEGKAILVAKGIITAERAAVIFS